MLTELLTLGLGLVVIAVIIAFNGLFVAQEFTYMAVDRPNLRADATRGNPAAKRALRVTQRTSFMLSGAQLGITVTGLLVGYVAAPLVGEPVGQLLALAGVPLATGIATATVFALVVASVVQMIFGELFPKNLALAKPHALALGLSRSTLLYLASFGWLIAFFDAASNALLKLMKVEPVHDLDISASAEDLEHIVEDSRESGHIPEELSVLLDRILDFPDRDVEHAMVPRSRTDYVSPDSTVAEVRSLMSEAHTRYPVIDSQDNPVGVIHLADVVGVREPEATRVAELMRTPIIVPTPMKLPDALKTLLDTRNDMACVIDEYGGFAGILTVEDLGEELVGDLRDEHDTDEITPILELGENRWSVPGSLPIDELERLVGYDLEEGDWETLGGLLIASKGGLVTVGETVIVPFLDDLSELSEGVTIHRELSARVGSLARRVPAVVTIEIIEKSATDDEIPSRGGSR